MKVETLNSFTYHSIIENSKQNDDKVVYVVGGNKMPLPHEYRKPHEEVIELIERKFRELNERLDEIEARLGK